MRQFQFWMAMSIELFSSIWRIPRGMYSGGGAGRDFGHLGATSLHGNTASSGQRGSLTKPNEMPIITLSGL